MIHWFNNTTSETQFKGKWDSNKFLYLVVQYIVLQSLSYLMECLHLGLWKAVHFDIVAIVHTPFYYDKRHNGVLFFHHYFVRWLLIEVLVPTIRIHRIFQPTLLHQYREIISPPKSHPKIPIILIPMVSPSFNFFFNPLFFRYFINYFHCL